MGRLASSPTLEEVRTGKPNKEAKQDILDGDLFINKGAMSWIRWSHDCMCRGQYEDAKEMLRKGLELARKEKTDEE